MPLYDPHRRANAWTLALALPLVALPLVLVVAAPVRADIPENPGQYIRQHYVKKNYRIPMRDGVHLYTIVYSPKDTSAAYPMLMTRTPYGIHPYEEDKFRTNLGPNPHFLMEQYIFVYQDVRGRYMSEGTFENVRPHNSKQRPARSDIDESTDTYDTIDWLVKNVPNHNGKVGLSGISYPGFYSSAGMIDAHPALKAVSPQAPIADWFFDDFFHHGAFFLPHAFKFFAAFGQARPGADHAAARSRRFRHQRRLCVFPGSGTAQECQRQVFQGPHRLLEHDRRASQLRRLLEGRNLLPHLRNVAPAVMTVGGWFDAEDLYGALNTYQAVEKQNPKIFNVLVMGAWSHGGWSRQGVSPGQSGLRRATPPLFFRRKSNCRSSTIS